MSSGDWFGDQPSPSRAGNACRAWCPRPSLVPWAGAVGARVGAVCPQVPASASGTRQLSSPVFLPHLHPQKRAQRPAGLARSWRPCPVMAGLSCHLREAPPTQRTRPCPFSTPPCTCTHPHMWPRQPGASGTGAPSSLSVQPQPRLCRSRRRGGPQLLVPGSSETSIWLSKCVLSWPTVEGCLKSRPR